MLLALQVAGLGQAQADHEEVGDNRNTCPVTCPGVNVWGAIQGRSLPHDVSFTHWRDHETEEISAVPVVGSTGPADAVSTFSTEARSVCVVCKRVGFGHSVNAHDSIPFTEKFSLRAPQGLITVSGAQVAEWTRQQPQSPHSWAPFQSTGHAVRDCDQSQAHRDLMPWEKKLGHLLGQRETLS